jgi:hypothetical protein
MCAAGGGVWNCGEAWPLRKAIRLRGGRFLSCICKKGTQKAALGLRRARCGNCACPYIRTQTELPSDRLDPICQRCVQAGGRRIWRSTSAPRPALFAASVVFFATENWRRERKVLCWAQVAVFRIGTQLLFGSQQKRLRGGRLLFPLRRKK